MTTTPTTPHPAIVALPPKAVSTEEWQPNGDGRCYRNFEGEIREVVAGRRYGAHGDPRGRTISARSLSEPVPHRPG